MAFDFPSSPTTGQTYSVTGGPTYVYNGTAWVVLTPGNQFNRTVFTATAAQTTFTMNYVVGAIDVYRNGVKLAPADFTATNGTSIVLLNAATVGDTIEVISYPMVTYSDAVKRTGDTMTGNLTVSNSEHGKVVLNSTTSSYMKSEIIFSQNSSPKWAVGVDVTATGANTFHLYDISANALRFLIDASGRITQPHQPAFSARRSSDFNSNNSVITYDVASLNTGSHYNTSNGRFTAPVSGRYLISASAGGVQARYVDTFIRVNGSVYPNAGLGQNTGDTGYPYGSLAIVLQLSAGDYVEHFYSGSDPVNATLRANYCSFSGYLIG